MDAAVSLGIFLCLGGIGAGAFMYGLSFLLRAENEVKQNNNTVEKEKAKSIGAGILSR